MTATYFYDLFHFNRFLICSTTSKQEIVFTLVVWLSLFNSALCQVCGVFSFLFVFSFFMKLPCWAFCQSSHNAILILLWNGSTFKLQIDKVNVLKNATANDLLEHPRSRKVGWRISGLLTLFFKFTRMQLVTFPCCPIWPITKFIFTDPTVAIGY